MVDITPIEYRVGSLDDLYNGRALYITLRTGAKGEELYSIRKSDHSHDVLSRKGTWEWEPRPSERTDEFIAATRFELTEAMIIATVEYEKLRKIYNA